MPKGNISHLEAASKIKWNFLNPEGVRVSKRVQFNPRPATLAGKNVVLSWNGKPNGDVLLDRLAELLIKEAKVGSVIKLWQVFPSIISTYSVKRSKELAEAILEYNADIVINSTCD